MEIFDFNIKESLAGKGTAAQLLGWGYQRTSACPYASNLAREVPWGPMNTYHAPWHGPALAMALVWVLPARLGEMAWYQQKSDVNINQYFDISNFANVKFPETKFDIILDINNRILTINTQTFFWY